MIAHGYLLGTHAFRLPELGTLEDRAAIQMAICTVVNALATEALDIRRATALLYGLQLASNNCIRKESDGDDAMHPVEEIVTTDAGDTVAPADRIPPVERSEKNSEEEQKPESPAETQPESLDTAQAPRSEHGSTGGRRGKKWWMAPPASSHPANGGQRNGFRAMRVQHR